MKCFSCNREYVGEGSCRSCYDSIHGGLKYRSQPSYDVVLGTRRDPSIPGSILLSVPAHRAVLSSMSPVFKTILENETCSGVIEIKDVSYNSIWDFINYLYTSEVGLDEEKAFDLLALGDKYQVNKLKTECENYLISRFKWENSLPYYIHAYKHNATRLRDIALPLLMDNVHKLGKRDDYDKVNKNDGKILYTIYQACHFKRTGVQI